MRHTITVITFCLTICPAVVRAQAAPDSARVLGDIKENLRSYQEDSKNRINELTRKAQVLRTLADGAASISAFSTSVAFGKAREKCGDAQRLAQVDPPLSEPIPSVLGAVSQLINQPGMEPTEQVKAKVFVAIGRLEEHVVEQAASIENEAGVLQGLEQSLSEARRGLRFTVGRAVGAAIHVRRLAIK